MATTRKYKLSVDSKTIAIKALKLTRDDLLPAAVLCIWTANRMTLNELKEEIEKAIEEDDKNPFPF